jgi:hypothetical protein
MLQNRSEETDGDETSLVAVKSIELSVHSDNDIEDLNASCVSEVWCRETK